MKTLILLSLIAPTVWLLAQVTPPRPPVTKSDAVLDQKIREIKARQLAQSLQPNLGGLKPGPLVATAQEPVMSVGRQDSSTLIGDPATRAASFHGMSIQIAETNRIVINFKTGEVTLPEGMPLDDVAKGFWRAVAISFPEAFDWEAMCSERALTNRAKSKAEAFIDDLNSRATFNPNGQAINQYKSSDKPSPRTYQTDPPERIPAAETNAPVKPQKPLSKLEQIEKDRKKLEKHQDFMTFIHMGTLGLVCLFLVMRVTRLILS